MRASKKFLTPNAIGNLAVTAIMTWNWDLRYPKLLADLKALVLLLENHSSNNPIDINIINKLLTVIKKNSRPENKGDEDFKALQNIIARAMLQTIVFNFSAVVNSLLEQTYWLPLDPNDRQKKQVLRDGKTERETHGAIHAVRVCIYIILLHHFCQKHFPIYTKNTMGALSKLLNYTEKEIIALTKLAAFLHDSAREAESNDYYEKQSADNVTKLLKEMGISKKLTQILSDVVYLKDKQNQFLEQHSTQAESDYLRILTNMSDCFDVMRCVSHFRLDNIKETLEPLFQYEAQHNPDFDSTVVEGEIITLAQRLHQFIYDQKDMLFDCKIFYQEKQIPTQSSGSNYSLKYKVSFEHSQQLYHKMLSEIRKDPFLKSYLTSLPPVSLQAEITPKPTFNPFPTGLNAKALPILKRTGFKLMPVLAMLRKYGLAPFTGELTQGGLRDIGVDTSICFGRFHVHKSFSNAYNMQKIVSNYARARMGNTPTRSNASNNYNNEIKSAFKKNFSNLNILTVYAARCKQIGLSKNEIYATTPEDEIENQFKLTIQYCYFILLFEKKIFPDYTKYKGTRKEKGVIRDAIYHHFSQEEIFSFIEKSKLDIKAIYEGKPGTSVDPIIEMLRLPKEITTKEKKIALSETQFFSNKKIFSKRRYSTDEADSGDIRAILYTYDQKKIACFLEGLFKEPGRYNGAVAYNAQYILKHIKKLKDAFALFKQIINNSVEPLSEQEKSYLTDPFPIMIVLDDEEKIELFKFQDQEHRWKTDCDYLTLGEDIKLLATDTEENKKKLEAYCQENKLDVHVVLFSEIKNSGHLIEPESTGETTQKIPEISQNQDLNSSNKDEHKHLITIRPHSEEKQTGTDNTTGDTQSIADLNNLSHHFMEVTYLDQAKSPKNSVTVLFLHGNIRNAILGTLQKHNHYDTSFLKAGMSLIIPFDTFVLKENTGEESLSEVLKSEIERITRCLPYDIRPHENNTISSNQPLPLPLIQKFQLSKLTATSNAFFYRCKTTYADMVSSLFQDIFTLINKLTGELNLHSTIIGRTDLALVNLLQTKNTDVLSKWKTITQHCATQVKTSKAKEKSNSENWLSVFNASKIDKTIELLHRSIAHFKDNLEFNFKAEGGIHNRQQLINTHEKRKLVKHCIEERTRGNDQPYNKIQKNSALLLLEHHLILSHPHYTATDVWAHIKNEPVRYHGTEKNYRHESESRDLRLKEILKPVSSIKKFIRSPTTSNNATMDAKDTLHT